jgi:outer membrane autotransporter protein
VRSERSCGWLRISGSWLERDAAGDDPGFDFDAVTTAIGGQAEVRDGLFLGGALGWESSRLKDDGNSTTIDGDSYLGAVSLKRETGPWTLTGALDLGWGSYDSTRQIAFGTTSATATGSPDAFNAGAHFRAAYEIPRDSWYLEPALEVDLAYVRLDGYTESGAGDFDLAVDETDTVVLTGTPWLKLGRRVDMQGGGVFDAYVSGGLSLSTGEDFDTTARFADAPPGSGDFTTRLDNPNLVGRISAGIDVHATDRIQLRLQYDGSFADDQSSNGGQFRISYFF